MHQKIYQKCRSTFLPCLQQLFRISIVESKEQEVAEVPYSSHLLLHSTQQKAIKQTNKPKLIDFQPLQGQQQL